MRIARRRRDVTSPATHPDAPPPAIGGESAGAYPTPADRLQGEVDGTRPAFYALDSGGWRDCITLLHPPYTLWHLSYVVLGAALSPTLREDRLVATLLAFFLAVGVSAHALDELNGRPLRTQIPRPVLVLLGAGGLVGAIAIGLTGAIFASPWLLVFVASGAFIAPAYNLEWFRGRFHTDFWFALSWGAFPFLTAYYASGERFEIGAALGTAAVFALSLAQRALSRRVRTIRRQTTSIEGRAVYSNGSVEDIDRAWLVAADERALLLMACAVLVLAIAVLSSRA